MSANPAAGDALTYEAAGAQFLAQQVRSPHTLAAYTRALAHFRACQPTPLVALGPGDVAVLVRYTQWLLEARGLAPASAQLYARACRRWFVWMGVNDCLPPAFPLAKALAALDDALRANLFRGSRRAPEPPTGIEETVAYYDQPPSPTGDTVRDQRARLENLRNRALVRVLAETGGRVSEVLALNAGDFPPGAFQGDAVWRVAVRGKGNHRYNLRFLHALPHIQAYLEARGELAAADPLFVHHSARYAGTRMSRQSAWAVVDGARRALGLGRIHPHDFRHWRATALVNAGQPLDVVQDYLGHRSVETTRAYYAHTREERVDQAVHAG